MFSKLLLFLLSTVSLMAPALLAGGSGSIQPNGITLGPLQQKQFVLMGYDQNVTWSVVPAGLGTITSTGLYTAPNYGGVAYIYAKPQGSDSSFVSVVYLSLGALSPGGAAPPPPEAGDSPTTASNPGVGNSGQTGPPAFGPTPSQPTNPVGPGLGSPWVASGVSVSVYPATAYLQANQSAVFTALIQGTPNQQVEWSISPPIGSIMNGQYIAPAAFGNDTQVTISATSLADSTKTATATVLLVQPLALLVPKASAVTISIAQHSMVLTAGQSAQFTAVVSGATNTGVNWSLTPNVGTIFRGLYTAPATVTSTQNVVLTAISQADPTKKAYVGVQLQPAGAVSLSMLPASAALSGGQSATFTPTVTGSSNTAVTWSLSTAVGTITNGVYQAPAIVASATTVTLTATSVADPTKSVSSTVALMPVGVTVGPASASLSVGLSATFTASVTGTANTSVTWSLNPQVGTVTNGVYKAPATIVNAQTVTVTASSVADPTKTASATVSLKPVVVTVGPASVSLNGGMSTTFTASVTGSSNSAVTWSLSPQVGTITNGVYQAPATIASAQTITVTATSVADPTESDTSTVSLNPVVVTVGPASALLNGGAAATFTASVTGTSKTAVTWSLNPQVGSITNGVYQAPAIVASQQTIAVIATSTADLTKAATSNVTLKPVVVSVGPAAVTLSAGKSATFTASITGSVNTGVTWSLSPVVGTVVNGVYTAPATIAGAQTVTVKAVSVADSTKTATASSHADAERYHASRRGRSVANGTTAAVPVTIPSGVESDRAVAACDDDPWPAYG